MSKPIKAWHWVSADRRLGYGDGRHVRAGRVQTMVPAIGYGGLSRDEELEARVAIVEDWKASA